MDERRAARWVSDGREPLTMDEVRMIATYAPEGVTDEDVEDLVRRVEHMHGILPPCKA